MRTWLEVQEKSDKSLAEEQLRHENDKIELYRALEDQQDRIMQRIGDSDKQIDQNDVKVLDLLHDVESRFEIIKNFKESINQNLAKIDQVVH